MTADEPVERVEITSSWTPAPQPVRSAPAASSPPPPLSPVARQTSMVPLVVLLVVNGLIFGVRQLPELSQPPWLAGVLGQLRSLASGTLVGIGGTAPVTAAPGDMLIVVALVGAVLLAWVVRSRFRSNLVLVAGAAVVAAVPLAIAVFLRFVSASEARPIASGLVLGAMAVAAAAATPVLVSVGGARLAQPGGARVWWVLLAYAVVYVAPLAVGRAALHAGFVQGGGSQVREYCAGLALGIAAWCIVQLVPPLRVGRVGTAFVLLAVALGPVLDVAAGKY